MVHSFYLVALDIDYDPFLFESATLICGATVCKRKDTVELYTHCERE